MGKKPSNKLPPFVALTWDMLNSQAYRKLPGSSAKMLPFVLGKVKLTFRDSKRYTTPFAFTYAEAKAVIGFGRDTTSGSIRALMEYGFIDPIRKGGLRGYGNSTSLFTLSERWRRYGTPAFELVRWEAFVNAAKS